MEHFLSIFPLSIPRTYQGKALARRPLDRIPSTFSVDFDGTIKPAKIVSRVLNTWLGSPRRLGDH
eukprot:scaffold6464_cov145-Skeletonema_menzelii.AAC.26